MKAGAVWIVLGYVTLIVMFGWAGLVAAAVHLLVLGVASR